MTDNANYTERELITAYEGGFYLVQYLETPEGGKILKDVLYNGYPVSSFRKIKKILETSNIVGYEELIKCLEDWETVLGDLQGFPPSSTADETSPW